MREIEADYLVVGAGASGMAFVDALLACSDARVVLTDRRHRPGGHWLDAYRFVRLHQPSAYYGVMSRRLGADRIDQSGPNAGFYERAGADEICDYYLRVLESDFAGTDRVRFLAMSDYRGRDGDGHHVVSLLSGAETVIRGAKLVDATYVASEVPSRHAPPFRIDPAVRLCPPNELVNLAEPPGGFTIIGGGKTAMDTCVWLLDAGVDPNRIRWIRPRDSWLFDRAFMQPLRLVGTFLQMQARWLEAATSARDGADFAQRLEAAGVFVRIDSEVEPGMFRGATISMAEIDALRSIERVVRAHKVHSIGARGLILDGLEIPSSPGELYVDCTAVGVPPSPVRPVFEDGRITLQYVTVGILPWSAATIAVIEATRDDDEEKNRLSPPMTFTGNIGDVLQLALTGLTGALARGAEPDLLQWTEACRLNPARGAIEQLHDPSVSTALSAMASHVGPAMRNLSTMATA